jgi:SAM-dependent methyltransferase
MRIPIRARVWLMLAICRICGHEAHTVGLVRGKYHDRDFTLKRCDACGFAFIADPWLDYAAIYDERYYAGEGADHLANYSAELESPEKTIRWYEWVGISRVVGNLVKEPAQLRWLDYGCGTGGLVRFVRDAGHDAYGFEPSLFADRLADYGVPLVDEAALPQLAGSFDVVTAIEVIEHTLDPVAELRRMRELLRPGGLLFLTTGNAEPYAHKLTEWRYVIPEIHVSYFEPRTLDRALELAGFTPERAGYVDGFDAILKFKVLKNLHGKRRSVLTDAIPARPIARLGERIARVSDQPIGWAR